MVTVPREYGANVQNSQSGPQYQTASAPSAAFGGPRINPDSVQRVAGDVQAISQELLKAQARIQERNDVVARAREFGGFNTFATESMVSLQSTGDIADPSIVKTYAGELDAKIAEIVNGHQGSEESRAMLAARLQETRSSLLDQAAVTSAAAGRQRVKEQMGTELSELSSQVGSGALPFDQAVAKWNSRVDEYGPSLTPEDEFVMRRQGPAAFVSTAVDQLLMAPNGDLAAMEMLQAAPGLMALLDPPAQEALRQRIRVVAQANAAERNKTTVLGQDSVLVNSQGQVIAHGPKSPRPQTEGAKKLELLNLYATLTNKEPTPDQIVHLFGMGDGTKSLNDKATEFTEAFTARVKRPPNEREYQKFFGVDTDKPQTLTEKVAEVRTILGANGKAMTDDQLNILLGLRTDESKTIGQKVDEAELAIGRKLEDSEIAKLGSFFVAASEVDNGSPDRDHGSVFANLAERYSNGETTALEDRELEAAVTDYTQLRQNGFDPDTGLPTYGRNELPDYVKKALIARGREVPGTKESDKPAAAGGSQGDQGNANAAGAVGAGEQAAGAPAATGSPATQDAGPPTKQNAASQRQPTIFELAPKVTGPEAATKQAVSGSPLVPGSFPAETEARSYVETELRNLVVALQNSEKYAEGERKALEAELDLKGGFLDDPGAYQDRIVGIDKALENRMNEAIKRAANPSTTRDLRQRSLDIISLIGDFRKKLMPPRFDTRAELDEALEGGLTGPVLVKIGDKYTLINNPKPKAKE